jgi:FkbM family methyltransferase
VIADGTRKAIDRVAVLGSVVKSRPGQHLVQTTRAARVVREPLRFTALQLRHARAADYRLRESGLRVFLRHRTRDVNILNEIFGGTGGHNSYEPPAAIASMIAARPAPKILDLGANIGLFGVYALTCWPGAQIHSFEPDPTNLRMLTRVIAANGLGRRWSVTPAAVANHAGEMTFEAGLFADSHLAPPEERQNGLSANGSATAVGGARTITVSVADLFAQDHDVDLMKMDIEGGEWPILADPRLAGLKADVLVLEWHARGCPEPDAHAATVRFLRAAGYSVRDVELGADNGLLWAWRKTR